MTRFRSIRFDRVSALAVTAVVVALTGCVAGGSPGAGQVASASDARSLTVGERPTIDGQNAWSGTLATAGMDMTAVARDERSWQILWQLIGEQPPSELPEDAMAAAVFLGPRPTDGYAVSIGDVVASTNGMVVRYSETEPASGADVTEAVIAPYAMTLLPATLDVVHFERLR